MKNGNEAPAGSAQQAQAKYITTNEPVTESYSDGIFGVSVRHGVAKVELYTVAGYDEQSKSEIRRISHRLALPMTGLNELAGILQRMAQVIRDAQQQQQNQQAANNPITT